MPTEKVAPGQPCLRTVTETARRLNVSTKTVRRMIEARTLPAHRVGRLVRVSDDEILLYLNHRRI